MAEKQLFKFRNFRVKKKKRFLRKSPLRFEHKHKRKIDNFDQYNVFVGYSEKYTYRLVLWSRIIFYWMYQIWMYQIFLGLCKTEIQQIEYQIYVKKKKTHNVLEFSGSVKRSLNLKLTKVWRACMYMLYRCKITTNSKLTVYLISCNM